jgi:hypothetical protein
VVVGVSQAYRAAKDAYKKAQTDGDMDAMDTAQKAMQEMESQEAHYYVAFAESRQQASKMKQGIESKYALADTFERLEQADDYLGGRDILGAFQRLRSVVQQSDTGLDAKAAEQMKDLMRNLYLTLLSENSARKSEANRKNVAGADGDMMRSFASNGRAMAHFIANVKANGKVVDALRDMKNETDAAETGRQERREYYNEIMRRHTTALEYTHNGMIEKAMAGTSLWMLLSKPSYYLQNMTQPWMMSLPMMAGKHDYVRSAKALMTAYGDLKGALKDGAFKQDDYSKLPKDVRPAIEELANRGMIDISLESVLGKFETDTDSASRPLEAVVQRLQGAAQTVESMNRLSTAMAAYRLEKQRGATDAAAIDYAEKVIYQTHGLYDTFNAPRFMRSGFGKLITQFRKFQLIQLSMFARFTKDAFAGASAEERLVARKVLAYQLAHLGAVGGLMGLPGFVAISFFLQAAFGDDDEPKDTEAQLRRAIGDKFLADLLLKGGPKAFGGPDTSVWIGAGTMLSILPFADTDISKDGYTAAVMGAMGPLVGGLGPRFADGAKLMKDGDYLKGLEQMTPAGITGVLKSVRYNTDGLTKRNGDVLLSPEEFSFFDATLTAMGLSPGKVADRNMLMNAQFKSDEFFKNRSALIKKDFSEAVRNGDEATRREAIEDWQTIQAARRRLGYKPQPLSDLLKAPKEQRDRERDTRGGVQFRKSNEGFTEQLM